MLSLARRLLHLNGFDGSKLGIHVISARLGWLLMCMATALMAQITDSERVIPGESTSTSYRYPVRLGSVDAVTGNLELKVPLGPSLPGRIPVRFNWTYKSQRDGLCLGYPGDNANTSYPIGGNGGIFTPVIWPAIPVPVEDPATTTWAPVEGSQWTVSVHGEPWTFYGTYFPGPALAGDVFPELGVDDDGSVEATAFFSQNPSIYASDWQIGTRPEKYIMARGTSSDGTRQYIAWTWRFKHDYSDSLSHHTLVYHYIHATRMVIVDGHNAIWVTATYGLHADPTTYFTNRWGDRVTMQRTDPVNAGDPYSRVFRNERTLDTITLTGTASGSNANYTISNSFGYDNVVMAGRWTTRGFFADAVTVGSQAPTTFTWNPDGSCAGSRLDAIQHPNNLTERFTYAGAPRSPSVLPPQSITQDPGAWQENLDGTSRIWPAITGITITDENGAGQRVLMSRVLPVVVNSVFSGAHRTTLVVSPVGSPTNEYRGVTLTHPTAGASALFNMSVILKQESIHGVGLFSDGTPASPMVDQTTLYDGWSTLSFVNPQGWLVFPSISPAFATRTRVYTPATTLADGMQVGAPTRITIQGAWDAFGTTQTDVWTDVPASPPMIDPALPSAGASDITPYVSPTAVHSQISMMRHWDATLHLLLKDREIRSLDGGGLPALREGATSVDLGVTTYTYTATGLPYTITNTRISGSTSREMRTYVPGKPMVQESSFSATGPEGVILPNPDITSVRSGKSYTYEPSPQSWLQTETDLSTGATTTYANWDLCGRAQQITDPLGVILTRHYDSFGRLSLETRLAKGSVGALSRAFTFDINGRWKTETSTAEARSLTTRTDVDAFGRLTCITKPDLSTQTTHYDGWGKKDWETGLILPNETPYHASTWTYDKLGRLKDTYDSRGLLKSTVLVPNVWGTLTTCSTTLQGLVLTVQDDRGYTRSTLTDMMNQKRVVLDQAGQCSQYFYERNGYLTRTEQGAQKRYYTYDDLGRMLSRTEPEEGTTTYSKFTLSGEPLVSKLTGTTGALVVTTTRKLTSHLLPDTVIVQGATSLTRNFSYKQVATTDLLSGFTESQPNGTITETYAYDDLNRLSLKTVSDGIRSFDVKRGLDAFGNEISLTYPGAGTHAAQTLSTAYDSLNRPGSLSLGSAQRAYMTYGTGNGTSSVSDTLNFNNGATTITTRAYGEITNATHFIPFVDPSYSYLMPNNRQSNDYNWSPAGLLVSRGSDSFTYDALQRLQSATVTGLHAGESASQQFTYDRLGNRTSSSYTYASGTGGSLPDELQAWSATYPETGGNRLPATVMNGGQSRNTNAVYDDLGRMTQVYAMPNRSDQLSAWTYDADGRIVSETYSSVTRNYLLDAEGLRFKRVDNLGNTRYAIYGFHRESLIEFDQVTQTTSQSSMQTASKVKTLNVGTPSCGAFITAPSGAITVQVGQVLTFAGSTTYGDTVNWNFGDSSSRVIVYNIGATNWTFTTTHAYTTPGTYTVTLTCSHSEFIYPTSTAKVTITVIAKPVTITASSTLVAPGTGVVLTWSANTGTSWTISGIGSVAKSGTMTVTPSATTTYTLTTSTGDQASVTVTVVPLPVISTFLASATEIMPGNSVQLSWVTTGGGTLKIDPLIGDVTGTQAKTVTPTGTTTYTLTATTATGSATKSVTVTVLPVGSLMWRCTSVYGFGQLISEEKPYGTYYVHADQVGSPNLQSDGTGSLKGLTKNLPFGERFGQIGETPHRRYTNHEDQPGSPIYMQARTYLPVYGRFAQVDPAYDQTKDDPESWNLYSYVANNPVTHTDPDGRAMEKIVEGDTTANPNIGGSEPAGNQGIDLGSYHAMINGFLVKSWQAAANTQAAAAQAQTGSISTTLTTTRLSVVNGGSGDYNATATLTQSTTTLSFSLVNGFQVSESNQRSIVQADLKTTPDSTADGSPTANGTYSWTNVTHHPNSPNGGFPTVGVTTLSGSDVLPTSMPNPNQGGALIQDNIHVHPPMPNNPGGSWNTPRSSLSGDHARPFSQGCWVVRPDSNGQRVIEAMRASVTNGDARIIQLNTSGN